MARQVTDFVLEKIKQWEGFVPHAYDDTDPKAAPVLSSAQPVRGTLTIGYGHTKNVVPGMRISVEQATQWLREDLRVCEDAVSSIVKVPLTDNQFGALVSFALNLGHSTAKGSPLANIAETLNKGDYAGAIRRMALYNKQRIGGVLRVVPGLVNRRAAEAGLWVSGEFVSSASVPADALPPAPPPAIDAAKIGTVVAAVVPAAPLLQTLGGVPLPLALAVVAAAVGLLAFALLRKQREAAR